MRPAIFLLFGFVCILVSAAFGYAYTQWTGCLPEKWYAGVSLGAWGLGAMFFIIDTEDDGF